MTEQRVIRHHHDNKNLKGNYGHKVRRKPRAKLETVVPMAAGYDDFLFPTDGISHENLIILSTSLDLIHFMKEVKPATDAGAMRIRTEYHGRD